MLVEVKTRNILQYHPSNPPFVKFGEICSNYLSIDSAKQLSSYTPPLRDPTQFPTFGESISQLDSPFAAPTPPFPFQSGRPNAFGSPPRVADRPSSAGYMSPLSLVTDRPDDPYNG
ncbi:hypothetical protein TELCIR_01146 [Teladorsagia circumcincta]|uniref:Uncharacterized protein n=1 Tax=Teladorsagia circumcincta TaxID=45464 RepID=A0A2G9V2P9_TELCI|nr:hypothetical protein TELCIR_01146 [Teladorsagia circumcincta]